MTIEEASVDLGNCLRQFDWYISSGIGENNGKPVIFLYVKRSKQKSSLPSEWEGFPIVVRKSGVPKPAV